LLNTHMHDVIRRIGAISIDEREGAGP